MKGKLVRLVLVSADFARLSWADAAGTASRLHLQLKGGWLAGQAEAVPVTGFLSHCTAMCAGTELSVFTGMTEQTTCRQQMPGIGGM